MHQAQPIRRRNQLSQLPSDLLIVAAGQNSHDARHRPRHAEADVRAADGVDDGATHEVRVAGGEEERAGILVEGFGGGVAEERGGEEGGDVGVVHYVVAAVAVNFEGVDWC